MELNYIPFEKDEGYFCGLVGNPPNAIPVTLVKKFEDMWIVAASDKRIFRVYPEEGRAEEIFDEF